MCSEKRGRDRRKETEWEIVTERRRRRRRDRRLSLLDLCVHYGMPSIPPSVRGRRHGNSCSSVTAETREMLDIKKWLIPTRLCWFILCVCVTGMLFHIHDNRHFSRCEMRAGRKHPDRGTRFSGRLFLWLVLTLKVFCHIQSSQRCSAAALIFSRNSRLETGAPSWDTV